MQTHSIEHNLILINDVVTQSFSFLGIEDRLSTRLTSRQFQKCTPSPWRLLGDVLEIANLFDVCGECNAKLSLGSIELQPDDGFNRARRNVHKCKCGKDEPARSWRRPWTWQGTAAEAALNAADETETAFFRSDPRRRPEYIALQKDVRNRSYVTLDDWITTGPFSAPALRTPEAERLRRLMDFSQRSVTRLSHHHEHEIRKKLRQEANSWFWPVDDDEDPPLRMCEYQIIHELASLKVAADELFLSERGLKSLKSEGTCFDICWYGRDMSRQHANMFNSRVIGIYCSWSGPQRECLFFYRQGILEDPGINGEKSLLGEAFGSPKHIAFLLGIGAGRNDNLNRITNAFGESLTERYFDALASVRKSWNSIQTRMKRIDDL